MPTSPMSWYIGNQLTARSDVEDPTPAGPLNASMFADRLRWVTTTPLGTDVEPDVNCTNAVSSADTVGCGPDSGAAIASSGSSVSHARTKASSGQLARNSSKCGWSPAVATTARAPHDLRMPAVAARYRGRSLVVAGG